MEMLCIGFTLGAIVILTVFLCVVYVHYTKEDEYYNIDKTADKYMNYISNNPHSSSMGKHWFEFEKGSEDELERLEYLADDLCIMGKILGMSQGERDKLADAAHYILYTIGEAKREED